MKVGDLFYVGDTPYIVTETDFEGTVKTAEPLESYIIRSHVVTYNGEHLSIKDLINQRVKNYENIMKTKKGDI